MMEKDNKAPVYLNKLLEIGPNDDFVLGFRELAYHLIRRFEKSLVDLNKSLDIKLNNAFVLRQRGDNLFHDG